MEGIKYRRLEFEHYYAQELFAKEELTGYLNKMIESQKSVYDYVIWDSPQEANFAKQLELSVAIKVYAKLPRWFQVPTPLGAYNPDWAMLVENEDDERLYFVAETKGTSFLDDLRISRTRQSGMREGALPGIGSRGNTGQISRSSYIG